MASQVQICNLALLRLGANSITSLTDNTIEARRCNLLFNSTVDDVSILGSWTSTIARATLAATTNTPEFGFTTEYQLPVSPKYLKVLSINESRPGELTHAIEGDKLLISLSGVKIKYISRITDSEKFDVSLKMAIIAKLSLELCMSITGDKQLRRELKEEFLAIVKDGLANDGQQGSKAQIDSNTLTEIR